MIQHKRLPTPQEFCELDVPDCRLYISAVLRHAGTYEQARESNQSNFRIREDEAAQQALVDIDLASLYAIRDNE